MREYSCRDVIMHKGSRYFIITVMFLLLALFESVSSSTTLQTTKMYSHNKNQVAVVSDDIATKDISFLPVVYVSLINTLINILRPDPSIIWQARIPRALWEICIAIIAKTAHDTTNPSICLLLCLMILPTALIDIFIWSPSFAMFAKFETCTGGGIISRQPRVCTSDYIKGIGRLLVSIQSLLTGVVYLFASVVSWITFIESRDSSIARKNARAMYNEQIKED